MPKEQNVVYVGRKPLMNYVLAVITSFSAANADKVVLKARGRAISTAVDVAEVSRRHYLENVKVEKISIGSEDITIREENRTKTVSAIEITLAYVSFKKEKPAEKHSTKLMDIKGIGITSAEKLKSSGINSVEDLINSDLAKLSDDLQISRKRLSRWVDQAKKAVKPD